MNEKFKVGDRVRIVRRMYLVDANGDPNLDVGNCGEVIEALSHGVSIRTDNGPRRMAARDEGWFFGNEWIELEDA